MQTTTTLAELNACDGITFAAMLDGVWEHAPWVATKIAAMRPFTSVDAMHQAMLAVIKALPEAELITLLAGHPDLAGPDARKGNMTADSIREQGALSLGSLPSDEAQRWDTLNAAYRARFGFPFILCARHYARSTMLTVFEQRLGHERSHEIDEALAQIGQITRLRLAARIPDHGMSGINGRLSTHVLDISKGRPAEGVRVALYEVTGDAPCGTTPALVDALTDARGRTTAPLISGEPLRIGRYELRFHVGDYFRRTGATSGPWPFLEVVPVVFAISEPAGDYHVPLTVAPWAYSTYRGQ